MTLQQLQYIVAVDNHRHFVKAAESCGVTQSTLSTMIRNLEYELDAVIFDRSSHPVQPTGIGEKIISQARIVLFNAGQLSEITSSEKNLSSGSIDLGIIPTVAPYILPRMFSKIRRHPGVSFRAIEARTATIIDRLRKAEIDMAILSTPLGDSSLLEIPLYYERFYAYISPDDRLWSEKTVSVSQLPGDELWILQEGHCFRNQIENLCGKDKAHSMVYESGSIDTLIKVVDENGGHTVIPELHLRYLTDVQKANVREIASPEPVREISLVIRNDYVKERMLNMVSDAVREIIPEDMLDSRLGKFAIRI